MKKYIVISAVFLVVMCFWFAKARTSGLAQTTAEDLNRLMVQVNFYYSGHEIYLGGSDAPVNAVVQVLSSDTRTRDIFSMDLGRRPISRGVDAWGRPIHVKTNPATHLMELRSAGPNGIDEFGQGDDIVKSFIIGK